MNTVAKTRFGARSLAVREGLSWMTGIAALGLSTGYLPPIFKFLLASGVLFFVSLILRGFDESLYLERRDSNFKK